MRLEKSFLMPTEKMLAQEKRFVGVLEQALGTLGANRKRMEIEFHTLSVGL